uniref:Uncharacterized protein n=1 Tax=Chromera velia CCMP2878 TaxID=1169474 RepID=A0A0G4FG06_9ALVE|eukprot:Cvel_16727.t1-p1 / transcript=Cvel_16727.t1 / gene=Cvel_16727 / organism=Chromera_velia_CCMP2878 / gene_product=hypothetical protein / transcript_product=hypothetical protein / location=Cvel_scaffold1301:7542-8576(+) / protein_length=327 / sequence_SO=supercontig / SO=protein_coding / is_pseudo=false
MHILMHVPASVPLARGLLVVPPPGNMRVQCEPCAAFELLSLLWPDVFRYLMDPGAVTTEEGSGCVFVSAQEYKDYDKLKITRPSCTATAVTIEQVQPESSLASDSATVSSTTTTGQPPETGYEADTKDGPERGQKRSRTEENPQVAPTETTSIFNNSVQNTQLMKNSQDTEVAQAAHAVIHPIPEGYGQDLQMIDGTLQQEMSTNYEGPTDTTGVLEPLTPLNAEMNTEQGIVANVAAAALCRSPCRMGSPVFSLSSRGLDAPFGGVLRSYNETVSAAEAFIGNPTFLPGGWAGEVLYVEGIIPDMKIMIQDELCRCIPTRPHYLAV